MASTTLPDTDVRQVAAEVFSHATHPWRRPELVVRAMPTFEGDDALYIMAVFPDELGHPSGSQQIDLQIELGDRLTARGDFRLVYLSTLIRSDFEELKALEAEGPLDAA